MFSLMSMANKPVGQLTDDELDKAARLIAGDKTEGLLSFFKLLRSAEPGVKVTDLLASPSANSLLLKASESLSQATVAKEGGTFCRCPNCHFPFISE